MGCTATAGRMELPLPGGATAHPAGSSTLRAGFGRADITPPPAGALAGFGPEGREARGYRYRLFARALLLEDPRGERLAFVVADLGFISTPLQREVAGLVSARTGIGADRLILSATHTHAGPGNYFASRGFDDFASSLGGFDPVMLRFLAERIAGAIETASDSLRPARAIWLREPVWGLTRNRSREAFANDRPVFTPPWPVPPGITGAYAEVDPTYTMLRVDRLDPTSGRYRPAGAMSIFAMHGTGNPNRNQLYDGDIQSVVERALERHIDSLNSRPAGTTTQAVHLFANGAEGDVSPAMREESVCDPPRPERGRRIDGPRAPRAPDIFVAPGGDAPQCLTNARVDIERIGRALGARAIEIFDRGGALLADPARERAARSLSLGRSFEVVVVSSDSAATGRCPRPTIGAPTTAGVGESLSRFEGWKLFGLIPLGFDTAGARGGDPSDCHYPKRALSSRLQWLVAGPAPFPFAAQLTVARVGGMLIGTAPGELTTTAGARARQAMALAAGRQSADSVTYIGLANGYIYYVATAEEYAIQHYEGSSTLYGPGTASFIAERLGALAAALPPEGALSAPLVIPYDTIRSGPVVIRFPRSDAGPPPSAIARAVSAHWTEGRDTMIVRWNDLHPGRFIPADGLRLAILRRATVGWDTVAWDDRGDVEVWAVKSLGGRGYLWEARWSLGTPAPSEAVFRVVLLPNDGMPSANTGEVR